jgi:hypothetical protein
MLSSSARLLVRWSVVFVMVLIVLAVTATLFLILADWLFDGAFTAAHQWLNRWSTPFDF